MSGLSELRDISPDAHNSAATAVKTREAGEWPVLDLPLLAEAICELADKVDALSARMPRSVIPGESSYYEDYEAQDAEAQRIRIELRQ